MSPVRAPRPAVPRHLRLPVAAVAAAGFVGLFVLALRYGGSAQPGGLDRAARARLGGLDENTPLEHIVPFADRGSVVAAAVIVAIFCLLTGHRRLAVVAIAGPGLTGMATTILKPLIDRTLDGAPALPSGHAGGATSLAAVTALLVVAVVGTRSSGTTVAAATAVVAIGALMGVALVAEGFHYATDTVAGFCTAVAVVGAVAVAVDAIADRIQRAPG